MFQLRPVFQLSGRPPPFSLNTALAWVTLGSFPSEVNNSPFSYIISCIRTVHIRLGSVWQGIRHSHAFHF